MNNNFIIYLIFVGYLGCFHFLDIANMVLLNIVE